MAKQLVGRLFTTAGNGKLANNLYREGIYCGCPRFYLKTISMAISYLSLTNQKLAYAQAIIRNLESPTAKQKLESCALYDAAVFHLAVALHFYLRELAEHGGIKNLAAINSIEDLVKALQQINRSSAEVAELYRLQGTANNWLHDLTGYYDQVFQSPEKPKEKKSFVQENRIELIELSDTDRQTQLELTPKLLSSWLNEFRALVTRQRETNAEY